MCRQGGIEKKATMIQMSHVYKGYPGKQNVLTDVNLNIEKGDFVLLVGGSRSGKTTLLNLIFGKEKALRGDIRVDGIIMNRARKSALLSLRRRVGVVFDDLKLFEKKTVFDNIIVALEINRIKKGEARKRVERVMHLLRLQGRPNSQLLDLSESEKQKVAIARAVVRNPKIILADEPFSRLDPRETSAFINLFRAYSAEGVTVLVATHNRNLISEEGAKTFILTNGKITRWDHSFASGGPSGGQ